MLIHLPSVASYLDPMTRNCYAAYQMGGHDKDSATPLEHCSQDWYKALSQRDRTIVKWFIRKEQKTSRKEIKHFTLRRVLYNLAIWKNYK